jgi:hypothetical protein
MNSFFNGLPFGTTQLKMAQTEAAKSEMTQLETAQPEAAKSEMTQLETAKSEMAQTEIFVEQDAKLGNGAYKEAFTLKPVIPGSVHNFSLPNESDIDNFCLVKFKLFINWKQESEFINKNKKYNTFEILKKEFYKTYKDQFDKIAELRKIFELGNKSFAPKLHQIRIDKVVGNGKIEYGIPFLPENMDAEFDKPYSQFVEITYVIEKCDESIIKFLSKNPDKIEDVGQKVVELIEAFVNSESQLICDIKSENFCPKIINGTFEKVGFLDVDTQYITYGYGPRFIKNAIVFMKYAFLIHSQRWGEKKKEKIDGKIKETRVTFNFGNLGITQEEVDDMIRYFYQDEYMKNNEYNPINMLYHYFINLHPYNFDSSMYAEDYFFLNHNRLIKYFEIDEIVKVFHDANIKYKIRLPAETGKTGGGSKDDKSSVYKEEPDSKGGKEDLDSKGGKEEVDSKGGKKEIDSKGGKNPRKRRKSKSKKRGRKTRKARTRKN